MYLSVCCDVALIESPRFFWWQTKEVTCGWIFLVSTVNVFTSLLLMSRNKQRSCLWRFVITAHLRREGPMSLWDIHHSSFVLARCRFWKLVSSQFGAFKMRFSLKVNSNCGINGFYIHIYLYIIKDTNASRHQTECIFHQKFK